MVITHNLGFPRIGKKRELKFALESYWRGDSSADSLQHTAQELRAEHWRHHDGLNLLPVGDFSFYDHVLDMSFLLGNIPPRAQHWQGEALDNYFRVARGRSAAEGSVCECIAAGEMTKWFDTNYHYIVPEFAADTRFQLDAAALLAQVEQARQQGLPVKPVIIGPLTYLWLGKAKDDSNKLDLLDDLVKVYGELLQQLAAAGVDWVQVDEPILVTELDDAWKAGFERAYAALKSDQIHLLLATYFGRLQDNLELACALPVGGLHLDALQARDEVEAVIAQQPDYKILSLGVIDGRNIWRSDLTALLDWLEPLHRRLGYRLWIAPSCSLLHAPFDVEAEDGLPDDIKSWLAFALQKLDELKILGRAINHGRDSVSVELAANAAALASRRSSDKVQNAAVRQRLQAFDLDQTQRQSPYAQRAEVQKNILQLPLYPTTTIGSFPQTAEIRATRRRYRQGEISEQDYTAAMQQEIRHCIEQQQALGLDVLVHGEPERNDMVEYFGEHLQGFAFTRFGWVQSYGSRCVKPPIIVGDIARAQPITVEWATFAQSLTEQPVKGMLTGPVTILNWSFVRDDQPRRDTCYQLALAMRDEVLDLEQAGIGVIQIDEAALREGLPLRKSQWNDYLDWAIRAFRICANAVRDETQIHTHMCYSEFNDIIQSIADMDADVITIETSRSDMELLDVFDRFHYANEIGPGVYDIHTPNIPSVESMLKLMRQAAQRIPAERLWVNPDCGLKTRSWDEVLPALQNMVEASQRLRAEASAAPSTTSPAVAAAS